MLARSQMYMTHSLACKVDSALLEANSRYDVISLHAPYPAVNGTSFRLGTFPILGLAKHQRAWYVIASQSNAAIQFMSKHCVPSNMLRSHTT
jgi:translation initiation factor 2B subunit (eIF-2B alpha/beta/delta family)